MKRGPMNYRGALDYLDQTRAYGIRPGLENTRGILDYFTPDMNLYGITYIQVAGTNGKGTTANFLASVFRDAGHRVGLFTSPYLRDIREQITINGNWISEKEFARSLSAVRELASELLQSRLIEYMPTYYETVFLVALHHFCLQKVGVAVLEVGMGGRLDATSVITPAVSVITSVGKDHTAYLGTRLRDIAAEKAGIIKEGVPVVCGCPEKSIPHGVIQKTARQKGSPFYNVLDDQNQLDIEPALGDGAPYYRCTYTTRGAHGINDAGNAECSYHFDVHLSGRHQALNAATAVKTLRVFNHRCCPYNRPLLHVPEPAIKSGIASTRMPGRIEILDTPPGVILDVSHNQESTAVLAEFLGQTHRKKLTLIYGVLEDKDYKTMLKILLPYIDHVVPTEPISDRALPVRKIKQFLRGKPVTVLPAEKGPEDAYRIARQLNREILVTGSFYLAGPMRDIILRGNGG